MSDRPQADGSSHKKDSDFPLKIDSKELLPIEPIAPREPFALGGPEEEKISEIKKEQGPRL